jgi:hypothetical protein
MLRVLVGLLLLTCSTTVAAAKFASTLVLAVIGGNKLHVEEMDCSWLDVLGFLLMPD